MAASAKKKGEKKKKDRLLVTGISSGLGRLLARRLYRKWDIIGIDRVDYHDIRSSKVKFHKVNLTKKASEDIFRREVIDAVVHLDLRDDPRISTRERCHYNVIGTMRLLDCCDKYDIRKVVILSTAAVYGAFPEHPTFITEEAPLRAMETYAGLRDRVEVDRYA